jgi:hypothetical protein
VRTVMRYRTLGLIAICLALSCGIAPVLGKSTTPIHKSFIVKQPLDLITVLENGDLHRLRGVISERGLQYVRAEYLWPHNDSLDYKRLDRRLNYRIIPVRKDELDESGSVQGLHWLIGQRHFTIWQLEHSSRRQLWTNFCQCVEQTSEYYPRSIVVSKAGGCWEFGLRHFGPSVSGKICAGSFWNVYYQLEHGKLKIWRIEVDST